MSFQQVELVVQALFGTSSSRSRSFCYGVSWPYLTLMLRCCYVGPTPTACSNHGMFHSSLSAPSSHLRQRQQFKLSCNQRHNAALTTIPTVHAYTRMCPQGRGV